MLLRQGKSNVVEWLVAGCAAKTFHTVPET